MDLIGFLYGFGLLQGFLLAAVLLFIPSGHRVANSFMAGLVVVMALNLLQNWLIRTGYYIENPAGAMLIPPLDFTWGPLLYLYAYSLTSRSVSWIQAIHFAPAIVFLSSSIQYMNTPTDYQSNLLAYIWSQRTDQLTPEVADAIPKLWRSWIDLHLQGSFFALQFGIYSILVLRQIKQHNQRMQLHFSSLDKMNLKWLRSLTLLCLLFLVIYLIFNRSQLLIVGHFDVNALMPSTPWIFLVFIVYAIGMAAIFQPSLIRGITAALDSDPNRALPRLPMPQAPQEALAPQEEGIEPEKEITEQEAAQSTKEQTKYERSGLSFEDAEQYKILLMQKMQKDELYLDCELTLPELAEHTGLTPHQVSQVINSQMNQNFFSFVNSYRIQMAKALMSDPETQNMPIVELAVEVGFKSKSSFYDAFKKATQMTPTQFKKSLSQ